MSGLLPALVLHLDVSREVAESRMTGDMDAAALMSAGRLFALHHDQLMQCYPADTLCVTLDANGSVEEVLQQCAPRVAAILA